MSNYGTPVTEAQLNWIGMDLDGTMAQSVWTPERDNSDIGDPIERNVNQAAALVRAGYEVVIWTARPWGHHPMIQKWTAMHLPFPVKQIVCGKPLFKVYIDDRNIALASDCWLADLLEIDRSKRNADRG